MTLEATQVETFDDEVVHELPEDGNIEQGGPKVSKSEIKEDPSKDTFDNGYYEEKDAVDNDSQVSLLDENDGKDTTKKGEEDEKGKDSKEEEDDEKEKSDKEKEEGNKESEEEKKDGEKAEDEGEKTPAKKIKIKADDKDYEIPLDATIKTKVKGKNEFVSLEDLRNNYSGSKAWTEEIEAAKSKQQEAEFEIEQLEEEKEEIGGHLEKLGELMDKEDGDPLDALYYLLDMTGRDVNNYSKRVFDFMEEKVEEMSEMDDSEKELYWTKKRLEKINNNQAAKSERQKQEQAQRELVSRVDQIRESHGVSEEGFVQAYDELVNLGISEEEITPQQVVEYSAIKPHVEKAEKIVGQFEDDLDDDGMDELISETASAMRKYPNMSDQDALTFAAKGLGYDVETIDDDINELNEKVGDRRDVEREKQRKVGKKKDDPNHIESFDDFDF